MIAGNRQLVQMIKTKLVGSQAALTRIAGIGETKTAKYGEEILSILEKHLIQSPAAAPEVGGETEP